jgi:hypothetical protein
MCGVRAVSVAMAWNQARLRCSGGRSSREPRRTRRMQQGSGGRRGPAARGAGGPQCASAATLPDGPGTGASGSPRSPQGAAPRHGASPIRAGSAVATARASAAFAWCAQQQRDPRLQWRHLQWWTCSPASKVETEEADEADAGPCGPRPKASTTAGTSQRTISFVWERHCIEIDPTAGLAKHSNAEIRWSFMITDGSPKSTLRPISQISKVSPDSERQRAVHRSVAELWRALAMVPANVSWSFRCGPIKTARRPPTDAINNAGRPYDTSNRMIAGA